MVLLRSGKDTSKLINKSQNKTKNKTNKRLITDYYKKSKKSIFENKRCPYFKGNYTIKCCNKYFYFPNDKNNKEFYKNAIKGYLIFNNLSKPDCNLKTVYKLFKLVYESSSDIYNYILHYNQFKQFADNLYPKFNKFLDSVSIKKKTRFIFLEN